MCAVCVDQHTPLKKEIAQKSEAFFIVIFFVNQYKTFFKENIKSFKIMNNGRSH